MHDLELLLLSLFHLIAVMECISCFIVRHQISPYILSLRKRFYSLLVGIESIVLDILLFDEQR